MEKRYTLNDYLAKLPISSPAHSDVSTVLTEVARGIIELEAIISSPEGAAKAHVVGENTDGDQQKALDIQAHDVFMRVLEGSAVGIVASEEAELPILLDSKNATLAFAMDPLDGSSNIETNAPVGTIFTILPINRDAPETSFFQSSHCVIAAGFVTYGPKTQLYISVGQGTQVFILDRRLGEFVLFSENINIPVDTQEYAINMSNFRHWHSPVRQYIDDCLAGEAGVRKKNFNMRWIASLVADASRIVARGGVFLYPSDQRKGYENGRLRLLYEAVPLAILIEQAGGAASTGNVRLLDVPPTSIHQRTPLIFGSKNEVAVLEALHQSPSSKNRPSPLFGKRGLFRS